MKVICLTWAGQPTHSATTAMVNAYLALDPVLEHAVFHVRLGLSVADLAHHIPEHHSYLHWVDHAYTELAHRDPQLTVLDVATLHPALARRALETTPPPHRRIHHSTQPSTRTPALD
ncbi:MAG: hypothetical protein ACRDS1_15060 [Pseudonocardiaceae bacterium]